MLNRISSHIFQSNTSLPTHNWLFICLFVILNYIHRNDFMSAFQPAFLPFFNKVNKEEIKLEQSRKAIQSYIRGILVIYCDRNLAQHFVSYVFRKILAPDESSTPLVRSSERLAAKRRDLKAESLETLYFTPINTRHINRYMSHGYDNVGISQNFHFRVFFLFARVLVPASIFYAFNRRFDKSWNSYDRRNKWI